MHKIIYTKTDGLRQGIMILILPKNHQKFPLRFWIAGNLIKILKHLPASLFPQSIRSIKFISLVSLLSRSLEDFFFRSKILKHFASLILIRLFHVQNILRWNRNEWNFICARNGKGKTSCEEKLNQIFMKF